MVTYNTNWMGPISTHWYRERGLVENGNITTYYSAGRIDIRDDSKCGYDGWDEYSVAPMHGEDWNALGDFLDRLSGEKVVPYESLIMLFEAQYGRKIRWWKDEE